jgi:septal ring factor EnvC (AmiA/AmiB activator)
MKLKLIFLSILICSVSFAGDITDQIVDSDRNLSKVKNMIELEKNNIQKLNDNKKKKAQELKQAEIEFKYNKTLIKRLKNKEHQIKKDMSLIGFKKQKLSSRKEIITQNIKAANFYLAGAGESEMLEALIMADEMHEMAAGLQIIARVNARLFDMIKELDDINVKLDDTLYELTQKKDQLSSTLTEKKDTLSKYKSKKTLIKQMYKMAAEDEKIQQEYVRLLESKQKELEQKISELEMKKIQQNKKRRFSGLKKDFKHHKKRLQWPVNGKIIERFGSKKVSGFKGVIHKKGIKILPNENQVASVYDGIVMHTDTAWGLGWFVIVEHHGGFYSLYANLDEIKVEKDQKVHIGEILGTIDVDHEANTPYLYFEIRIRDKAVNPMIWLTSK